MTEISYQSCCISNKKRGFRGRHKRSPYPHQSNYLAVSRQAVLLKKFSGLMYGRLANETLFRRSSTVDPSRTEKHRQESPSLEYSPKFIRLNGISADFFKSIVVDRKFPKSVRSNVCTTIFPKSASLRSMVL